MSGSNPCTFLEWDSRFFGHRIARVESQRLDADLVSQIAGWSRDNKIDCLYFLADGSDSNTIVCAEQWNAHFTDIRVTMRTKDLRTPADAAHEIRPCTPEDLTALRHIARTSHNDGRFFFDPRFTQEQCESFYEKWITRSYEGFASAVLVAGMPGKPVGYVTCQLDSAARSGRIGLFAIAEEARGLGVGRSLAIAALRWFAEGQVDHVEVVTQGRNVAAQRLYAKCGFRIHSIFLWYHKWFDHE